MIDLMVYIVCVLSVCTLCFSCCGWTAAAVRRVGVCAAAAVNEGQSGCACQAATL